MADTQPRALAVPANACQRPPPIAMHAHRHIRDMPADVRQNLLTEFNVEVDGTNPPNPTPRFVDLKLHPAVTKHLANKGIVKPTPIQMQALPVLLSGRDMIGVAFTGSGKTLAFSLPCLMFAFEQERKLPFQQVRGHLIVLCVCARVHQTGACGCGKASFVLFPSGLTSPTFEGVRAMQYV